MTRATRDHSPLPDHILSRHPRLGAALAFTDRAVASKWGILAAIATYFAAAIFIGIDAPGLQFDEAIFEHGGIHILKSTEEPQFAHNRGTWIKVGNRHVPLMVLPYIGSMPFFVHALAFSVFGGGAVTARTVNLIMGAVGIWGSGRLGQSWLGPRLGTALAFVLAIHPGYLTWTMYDNSGVSIWMAALGILCLALVRYVDRFDRRSAFLLGVCLGFAVWCRANYVWLFMGALVALTIVLRRRIFGTARHWPVLIAGAAVGSFPLTVYQIASGLGTLTFMQTMSRDTSPLELLPGRLATGAAALVYDPLRRIIWSGPDLPIWHVVPFALLLVVSVATCILARAQTASRGPVYRIVALALVFTVGLTLTSRIALGPYHFVVYLPLSAFVVLAASQVVAARWPHARVLLLGIGVGYMALALSWDVRTAVGIRETGGVAMWSDGVYAVAETIESKYRGKTITVLDWGLTNNLYVLTSGAFRPRELYWGSTADRTGLGASWAEEISQGGIYLLNGPANGFNRPAGNAFRRAVEQSQFTYTKTEFYQKSGQIYAELYEISRRPRTVEHAGTGLHTEFTERRIVQLFPNTAIAGQPLNQQPDGSSAVAVRGTGFSRHDRIYWNGHELVTTFGSSELLTAVVPEAFLRQPGAVKLSVRDVFNPELGEPSATLKVAR